MTPLPFVWPYALPFWLVFIWAFSPEFEIIRRASQSVKRGDSKDAGSCRMIVLGMNIAFLAAFPLAFVHSMQWPAWMAVGALVTGMALLVAGSLLRRHCWRVLGSSFTGDVQAHAEQKVMTAGAYAFVRHPSYTAGIMMNLGVGIALGSWATTLILGVASVVVYIYRMNVEERALLAAIGAPYQEFLRTRKRLIPYIY